MDPKVIQFTADGTSNWAGMRDYILISPNQLHRIVLTYKGEPPHGDSYHRGLIDGRIFPGYIWGCMFAFSACSRYVIFSWMTKLYARQTVVVDLKEKRYTCLREYIYDFTVAWPVITAKGQGVDGKQFVLEGSEIWLAY
ncbi:MAG: hypothetical protein E6Q34_00650 [Burkholderiaceae bacterium]|nr:MAG: hypothetical protein E6Q34_00650 [Burkholderiaceae bacterium]